MLSKIAELIHKREHKTPGNLNKLSFSIGTEIYSLIICTMVYEACEDNFIFTRFLT